VHICTKCLHGANDKGWMAEISCESVSLPCAINLAGCHQGVREFLIKQSASCCISKTPDSCQLVHV
jgi:hypothetical protein